MQGLIEFAFILCDNKFPEGLIELRLTCTHHCSGQITTTSTFWNKADLLFVVFL